MPPRIHRFLASIGALALIIGGLLALDNLRTDTIFVTSSPESAGASAAVPLEIAPSPPEEAPPAEPEKPAVEPKKADPIAPTPALAEPAAAPATDDMQVARIQNPYSFQPFPLDIVNASARAALVNILCIPSGGSMKPVSGSGVIIDPRGVVLTNAHVAQYVLLAQDARFDLSCTIRTGSPAAARWEAMLLYLPPVWVSEHVADIKEDKALGTGEHDFAFLLITNSVNATPLPSPFPYAQVDAREGITFQDDEVLVASYPAEFLGGLAAQNSLHAASSPVTVGQLMTFGVKTIDLVSLGGIIEAQSGSSGGAVVNLWNRLVGLIATMSEGTTTAQRDLRAITLSYIDRDLKALTGFGLSAFLQGDLLTKATNFSTTAAPKLSEQYYELLSK